MLTPAHHLYHSNDTDDVLALVAYSPIIRSLLNP